VESVIGVGVKLLIALGTRLRNRKGLPITFSIVIGEVDGVLLVLANTDFATWTLISAICFIIIDSVLRSIVLTRMVGPAM